MGIKFSLDTMEQFILKNFNQHGIFRLGDIVKYPTEKQIFEIIEDKVSQLAQFVQ